MRDTIKDSSYFKGFISREDLLYKKRIKKLSDGIIAKDRVEIVKADMSKNKLYECIAMFSLGLSSKELLPSFYTSIDLAYEGWCREGAWRIKDGDKILNQYGISAYYQMLTMLSLGCLLSIPDDKFQLLVDIIDRDSVRDNLFEFIISAKYPSRVPVVSESYEKYFFIPHFFDRLRNLVKIQDKKSVSLEMKEYLSKDWYKIQEETGIKDLHKSRYDIYYGYWSFESAAIVKILGLDDSTFIDNKYYPKDLVHQLEKAPKKKGLLGKLGF